MNENMGKMQASQRKKRIRDTGLLAATIIGAVILLVVFPEKYDKATTTMWDFSIEMLWILPAVMVLMGLFAVWVSRETVMKYLGKGSGIKGIMLSVLLGSAPTGPLYVAFPMAAGLLQKGARVSNIVVFLSAWACIKLPQEMVEIQFFGIKWMALRLVLTVVLVTLMGLIIERLMERGHKPDNSPF
ncbi:MAG: permease [Dehalococcoidia bacterium]